MGGVRVMSRRAGGGAYRPLVGFFAQLTVESPLCSSRDGLDGGRKRCPLPRDMILAPAMK